MQINRLFEIVYLLINRKKMTAQELADYFEVSKRTIFRDIDTLTLAGVPIYTLQGKGGGISILDNFVLNKALLNEEDQKKILFSLQSLYAVPNIEADDILVKLQSLFNMTDTSWIEVDFSRWGSSEADKHKFEILKNSIIQEQGITFSYSSSYGETSMRTVYPLKLVFKFKAWYLQAFCLERQDYRTFKINRMQQVEIADENFVREEYLPIPIKTTKISSQSMIQLELRFPPHVAYRVYDEFDEGSIEKEDDGCLYVRARMPEDSWLYGFLLSFGKDISIISPEKIREHIGKYFL